MSVFAMSLALAAMTAVAEVSFVTKDALTADGTDQRFELWLKDGNGLKFPMSVKEMSRITITLKTAKVADFRMCVVDMTLLDSAEKWLLNPQTAEKPGDAKKFWDITPKAEDAGMANVLAERIDKGEYYLMMLNANWVRDVKVEIAYKVAPMAIGDKVSEVGSDIAKAADAEAKKAATEVTDAVKKQLPAEHHQTVDKAGKYLPYVIVAVVAILVIVVVVKVTGKKKSGGAPDEPAA
jgi:hypothetical protein